MYLDSYRNSLPPLCRKHHVKALYAFGSVLTDRFGKDSDIDLIVAFDNQAVEDAFVNFFDLKYSLEELFSRPVDLLSEQPIRNPVLRRSIERTKQLIYGRAN
ncbi:MAG: nucleotidyltransferase domain-containing protein [Bacteroidales bacterium]|jgi:predicted nucleotidyltransferase|nr:nucleotidyltransferase domain-containing protein [Bacteroidales bacterium]